MARTHVDEIARWLQSSPGIFSHQQDGDEIALIERFSTKLIKLSVSEIEASELKAASPTGAWW